jgi:predicted component of viral defense system (DUF524 family)
MILEQGGLPGGGFVSLTISRPNGDGEIDNALIEETNYSFNLEFGEAFPLAKPNLEPSELFEINNLGGSGTCIGRFLTGDHVGTISVSARFELADGSSSIVQFSKFEIRPKKLNYEIEYKKMLADVADKSAEALMHGGFIASDLFELEANEGKLDLTALSFLANKLESEEFRNALATIRARPDHRWVEELLQVPPGKGSVGGQALVKAISQGGRKVKVPPHLDHLPVRYLPERIPKRNSINDFDSIANRFIKHILLTWQLFATEKIRELQAESRTDGSLSPRIGRAVEKLNVIDQVCSSALRDEPLRSAGRLTSFPQANTVLTSRPGYRDVFRMFLRYRLEAKLAVPDAIDPFSISKKSVSELYEMWCYLEVLKCLEQIMGQGDYEHLYKVNKSKFALNLVEGEESRVDWQHSLHGRKVQISLWYNRTFNSTLKDGAQSWSKDYKPDISMHVRPIGEVITHDDQSALDVWVHFDAKYKLEVVEENIVRDVEAGARVTKDDVSKMHAYRDAIRKSAGAYVLFPGTYEDKFEEFDEILPGVGAFPLRPAATETEEDQRALTKFLSSVIDHCCNQATKRERSQFWQNQHLTVQTDSDSREQTVKTAPFLTQPPADTRVLVAYVRPENVEFVRKSLIYNLRADSGRAGSVSPSDLELTAHYVLLWTGTEGGQSEYLGLFTRKSNWYIMDSDELSSGGYMSSIKSSTYFVCNLEQIFAVNPDSIRIEVGTDGAYGSPQIRNWRQIFDLKELEKALEISSQTS